MGGWELHPGALLSRGSVALHHGRRSGPLSAPLGPAECCAHRGALQRLLAS